MRIRFEVAYRGVLTGERFYPTATVVEMDRGTALALIDAGRASPTLDFVQWGQAPVREPLAGMVRPEWIEPLAELGIASLEALAGADVETLVRVKGIGSKTARRLKDRAAEAMDAAR